jgi:NAD(P)-dependent dehydrogenase (short-subunit alcohol dehydrogenase family)
MPRFEGKIGVVTGAGGGIGWAVAQRLAEDGAEGMILADVHERVFDCARDLESANQAICVPVVADAGDEAGVQEYVAAATTQFGRIDLFHNNAGISGPRLRLGGYPEDAFREQIRVNLRGIFLGLRFVLPLMVSAGSGAVVNTASTSGVRGSPGFAAYTASKHGVIGLTRAAAVDYARSGVRINAVCPGPTQTGMADEDISKFGPGDTAQLLREHEERLLPGRFGSPPEIAAAVSFLLSNDASYVQGACLLVDGGFTAAHHSEALDQGWRCGW